MTENGKSILKEHESYRSKPYDDKTGEPIKPGGRLIGQITIGWGHNLSAVGLPREVNEYVFDIDVRNAERAAARLIPTLDELAPARRDALINMAYNMGAGGLASFQAMLAAVAARDWNTAADEMLESVWAVQVGRRAEALAYMMRTGDYPPDELSRFRSPEYSPPSAPTFPPLTD